MLDPESATFQKRPIPSRGVFVPNMVGTPDARLYLACIGVNSVAVAGIVR